ncbi:MAG TPA: glycerol-3-phosphate dehydrogenase/oxidase [Solirubrobacteraceae bacterium]|nr:glycerol-3-phosphate dehydrogenase/oxidase [Solirubrobacteraceae bacterium]
MSASLNAARRAADVEALAGGDVVDVAVVGGGITGVGVALDAASRGLSVALLERRDLAHGTSRWSSKLVHGGLRYLAHGDVALAWECAVERAALIRTIAPHLVRPLAYVIPLDAAVGRGTAATTLAGLWAGDTLRGAARTSRRVLPRARRVSALEARRLAPALRESGLRGALLSWDGQLEDDARLVVAVARTAAAHGARVVTYAEVTGVHDDGVEAVDTLTGAAFTVRARRVVLAAGVWTGGLTGAVALRPSRGSHVLVRAERLGNPRATVNVPVPGERGRWVFAVPRPDGLVAIGLTDVPAPGPVDDPEPDPAEEADLLARASAALEVPLTAADVAGRYAGLRPLAVAGTAGDSGGATGDLSRRHVIEADPDTGALVVVGGKLTTYRRMAQDVVDRLTDRPCRTQRLPLVGAAPRASLRAVAAPDRLVRRYGTEAPAVVALADGRPALLEPVAEGVPACGAELLWAVRHELALTPEDLADRRTRAGLVPEWRDAVLAAAAPELARA